MRGKSPSFHLAATQQARVDLLEAAFALDYAALRDVRVYGDYRNALALRFIKREALRLLGAARQRLYDAGGCGWRVRRNRGQWSSQ